MSYRFSRQHRTQGGHFNLHTTASSQTRHGNPITRTTSRHSCHLLLTSRLIPSTSRNVEIESIHIRRRLITFLFQFGMFFSSVFPKGTFGVTNETFLFQFGMFFSGSQCVSKRSIRCSQGKHSCSSLGTQSIPPNRRLPCSQ